MSSGTSVIAEQPHAPKRNTDFYTPLELKVGDDSKGYPRELEILKNIDFLRLVQDIELFEAIIGIETKNKYRVKNSLGVQCFYIQEESDLCNRVCSAGARRLTLHFTDNNNKEAIRLRRPDICCICPCCIGCGNCEAPMFVESPPGNVIGQVNWDRSCWYPAFKLADKNQERFGTMNSPHMCCWCCWDIEFPIAGTHGKAIGHTTRLWKGCSKAWVGKDSLQISFPMDLDPKAKAIMLASVLAMDLFAEQNE